MSYAMQSNSLELHSNTVQQSNLTQKNNYCCCFCRWASVVDVIVIVVGVVVVVVVVVVVIVVVVVFVAVVVVVVAVVMFLVGVAICV